MRDTLHRISNRDHALTHLWISEIVSFSDIVMQFQSKSGGYVKPSYGTIVLKPSFFPIEDWMPDGSCVIKVMYSTTTEEAAITLFDGTAHITKINKHGVTYKLYAPSYDAKVDDYAMVGYLDDIVTAACTELGVDVGRPFPDRAVSVSVKHTTGDVFILEELNRLCAFYSFYFKIEGDTPILTLYDSTEIGDPTTITEYDILPSDYEWPPPYSQFKVTIDSDDTIVDGLHSYGAIKSFTSYHDDSTGAELALADLSLLYQQPIANLRFKNIEAAPVVGDFLSLRDESQPNRFSSHTLIQKVIYNFNNDRATGVGLLVGDWWIDPETWTDGDSWRG